MFPRHFIAVLTSALFLASIAAAQQPSHAHASTAPKTASTAASALDAGSVTKDVYRNPVFGFTCKIPEGWVLRTDELNAREADAAAGSTASSKTSRVLLAAFSRPPEAHGDDINSSILIAAESASTYPGLKEAAQYFGPIGEIAKAQGLEMIQEPYDFEIGAKILPRSDFQKDVGTRVMLQSTLAMLSRGYVVSLTFIGGTEDEIEDLIAGLSFPSSGKPSK